MTIGVGYPLAFTLATVLAISSVRASDMRDCARLDFESPPWLVYIFSRVAIGVVRRRHPEPGNDGPCRPRRDCRALASFDQDQRHRSILEIRMASRFLASCHARSASNLVFARQRPALTGNRARRDADR
jgi:hypothetical protein